MSISLSHFEIKVRHLETMEGFYTRALGFVVTDRSQPGEHPMVFLSRNPNEHHQIVLNESDGGGSGTGSLDHLAFRIKDLEALRSLHGALQAYGGLIQFPTAPLGRSIFATRKATASSFSSIPIGMWRSRFVFRSTFPCSTVNLKPGLKNKFPLWRISNRSNNGQKPSKDAWSGNAPIVNGISAFPLQNVL